MFIKKVLLISLLFFLGCTTATIPVYLRDKKPYVRRYYTNYDTTLAAVNATLKDLGWVAEKSVDPAVYEQARSTDLDEKQLLIITEVRQTPLVVGTRYARMNIFLRSKKEISEVEIRYLTMSSVTFKTVKDYANDSEVKRIFGRLEEILNKTKF
jgi:hypothetical protein